MAPSRRPPSPADEALQVARRAVPLAVTTSDLWCRTALAQPAVLLADHAQCELKAASVAVSLMARHFDRPELARRLVGLAQEELIHYRQVRDLLAELGHAPTRLARSPYMAGLTAGDPRGDLLSALLTCAVVEARSCERFVALSAWLARPREAAAGSSGQEEPPATLAQEEASRLGRFYAALSRSESGHAHLFVDLARRYHPEAAVQAALEEKVAHEAHLLATLPVTPRMHGGNGAEPSAGDP